MRLVLMTDTDKPIEFDGVLSPVETQLIKKLFGLANTTCSVDDRQLVHSLLMGIHARKRWIACDCLGETKTPALLHTYKIGQNFGVRRMPNEKRMLHSNECPFKFDRKELEDDIDAKLRSEKSLGQLPNLLLYTSYSEHVEHNLKSTIKDAPSVAGERRSKLASVLFHLLTRAGLDSVAHSEFVSGLEATKQSRKKLREAVSNEFLDGSKKKLPLRNYWIDFPQDLEGLKLRLLQDHSSGWPKNKRKTGYLLLIAEDVSGKYIIVEKGGLSLYVEVELTCFARPNSTQRPPYIVLCAITTLPDDPENFKVTHAYAHPVYSRNLWIPVDSEYEREVLWNLIELQGWLTDKRSLQICIQKPLQNIAIDMIDGQTTVCRPDFILHVPSNKTKQVVIEVMGFESEEYRAKKQITLPRMRALGPVYEVSAYLKSQGRSMDEIMKVVKPRLIAQLLQESNSRN
jgi:hypothetical protein